MARPPKVIRARELRRALTLPEVLLWTALRARPEGFKFRRQHPVGPYVLDFYCPAARLAVEVDGLAHDMGSNPVRASKRDAWLGDQAIKTMRFAASDVLNEVETVVRAVVAECDARSRRE